MAGVAVAVVGVLGSLPARSQETCRTRCWDAYGACYQSTSNRQRCQGQLLRCLSNCIRANRRPAAAAPAATRSAARELRGLLSWDYCAGLAAAVRRQIRVGAQRL
jgi:hypothetical protein